MSAVEEVEAAIVKLTKLRDESEDISPKPLVIKGHCILDAVDAVVAEFVVMPDLDLFATLHATIDAQLMTLEAGLETCGAWGDDDPAIERIIGHTLAIARAINGAE